MIIVPNKTVGEIVEATTIPIIFVTIPPKYGMTVVTEAKIPNNNQLGCPTIKNKIAYSNN